MKDRKPFYGPVEDQTGPRLEIETVATEELPVAAAPETALSQCALGMTDCPGMEEIGGKKTCFFRKLKGGVGKTSQVADECEIAAAINVQL